MLAQFAGKKRGQRAVVSGQPAEFPLPTSATPLAARSEVSLNGDNSPCRSPAGRTVDARAQGSSTPIEHAAGGEASPGRARCFARQRAIFGKDLSQIDGDFQTDGHGIGE